MTTIEQSERGSLSSSQRWLSLVIFFAGVSMLIAIVALPWITLVIARVADVNLVESFTGWELVNNLEESIHRVSVDDFRESDMSLRTVWIIVGVGALAILGGLMGLIKQKGLAERDWTLLATCSLAGFYPFYFLYTQHADSTADTYLLESGFWIGAVANAVVLLVSAVGALTAILKK